MTASLQRSSPLFDQIYEVLWQRILQGEIRPGARISDLDWSAKLGVSRTPVREAMRKLQQDGIVLPLDRGGYELRVFAGADLAHLYSCRGALEALAARGAAQAASQAELGAIRRTLEQAAQALESEAFDDLFRLNTDFHAQIIAASGNPYLARMLHDLSRMILFARSTLLSAAKSLPYSRDYLAHLVRVQNDHFAVMMALEARDAAAAGNAMEQHIANTSRDMIALSEELCSPAPAPAS